MLPGGRPGLTLYPAALVVPSGRPGLVLNPAARVVPRGRPVLVLYPASLVVPRGLPRLPLFPAALFFFLPSSGARSVLLMQDTFPGESPSTSCLWHTMDLWLWAGKTMGASVI